MAKAARRILVTLACIVVLMVAGMLLLESQWAREWLEDQVSQRLNGRSVEIGSLDIGWGWPLTAHIEDITVANPDWAPHDRMVDIKALNIAVDPGALLTGQLELQRLGLSQPVIHLAKREDGTSNWGALAGKKDQQSSGGGLGISPDIVKVDDGHLTYRDASLETDLSVDFGTSSEGEAPRQLQVAAQGTYLGMPLELKGRGGAPSQALAEQAQAYPLQLEGHIGQVEASFEGQVEDIAQLDGLQGSLAVSAPQDANVAKLLGRPELDLPAIDVQGQVRHQDDTWAFEGFDAQLGESRLQGDVAVSLGERPNIKAQVSANQINLNRWGITGGGETSTATAPARASSPATAQVAMDEAAPGDTATQSSRPQWEQRLAEQLAPLEGVDAQLDLKTQQLTYGDTTLSDVALEADLEQGQLDVQRLHARQGEGELTASGQVNVQDGGVSGNVEAQLDQVDLDNALAPLGYSELGTWDGQVSAQLPDSASGQARPRIEAQLNVDRLNLDALTPKTDTGSDQAEGSAASQGASTQGQSAEAEPSSWDQRLAERLAPLQGVDAQLDLSAGELSYGDTTLNDVALEGSLEQGQLDVQRLQARQGEGELTASGQVKVQDGGVSGDVEAQLDQVDLGKALAPLGYGDLGTWNGQVNAQLPVSASGQARPRVEAQLNVDRLNLDALTPKTGASSDQAEASAASQDDTTQGQSAEAESRSWDQRLAERLAPLQGVDAQLDLSAGELSYGDTTLNDVALEGSLEQGQLDVQRLQARQGEGELTASGQASLQSDGLSGNIDAQLDQVDLGNALAPLGIDDLGTWNGRISGQWPGGGQPGQLNPRLDAQINIDRLDLDRWLTSKGNAEGDESATADNTAAQDLAWDQRLAERLAPYTGVDSQLDLSVDRLNYGDLTLRDVALEGDLEQGRLEIQRLHAAEGKGELTASGWLDAGSGTLQGDIDAQLDNVDLGALLGNEEMGTLDGRLHARIADGALKLDDTSLDYVAPAQELALHVNAESVDMADSPHPGVRLWGSGSHNGAPFEYDLQVGSLLDLRNSQRPYPISGTVESGDSTLTLEGRIEQPLDMKRLTGTFQLSGPNPARLNDLTGLNLPGLPPYSISGEVRVRDDLVRLLDLEGTFGNSDVSGDVRLRLGERNMLWATLHSQRLDLDDLAPLAGAAPDTAAGEAASPAQRERARQEEAQPDDLFPDAEWDLDGLRAMDANVVYSADEVVAEDVPLSDVSFELTLENGVMTLEPLRLAVGGGIVDAKMRMEALADTLVGRVEFTVRGVNLKPLLRRADVSEIAEDSVGTIGGEGRARFRGSSMDEVMASLDGRMELAMSGGRLDMLLIEALGLDVSEALLAALADADRVPMQCAYTRLDADSGIAAVEQFFISTVDSNITGGGEFNLDRERLELVFEAHPKDPSLLASDSPVQVQGPITNPHIEVVSSELIARGLLSVLGAVVAPPLAILPWLEPGLGEGSGPGCRQVLMNFQDVIGEGTLDGEATDAR